MILTLQEIEALVKMQVKLYRIADRVKNSGIDEDQKVRLTDALYAISTSIDEALKQNRLLICNLV